MKLRAEDHKGMLVDYQGMLRQARESLRHGPMGDGGLHAELLRQLQEHLTELGDRFYAGDVAVVDEFLQLYCIARDKRATPVPVDTEEAIQALAKDLPEGYRVELSIEKDAGDVYLTDPHGNLSSVHGDGDTMGEKLLEALKHAQEDAAP